jgi:hypothetical protein
LLKPLLLKPLAHSPIWERLVTLTDSDIERSFQSEELLIMAALRRWHVHIMLERTRHVLERALSAGPTDTRERAKRLIHTLRERGFVDFGRLLAGE